MTDAKKDILWRIYLVYLVMGIFAIAVLLRVVQIQFMEGAVWKEKAREQTLRYLNIDANRGNVLACDGRLLAASVPIFEIRMDAANTHFTNEFFNRNIDSLAYCLANLFRDKPKQAYKNNLIKARNQGNRYFLIKRNVAYAQLKKLRKFPIFRKGKYKGGLIVIPKTRREMPFKKLAKRTIGYESKDKNFRVGIEGYFSAQLQGVSGKRLVEKIANGIWMPMNDANEIEPRDGSDVVTTIDVNIQDVAENALANHLVAHNAEYGCAVLMEVATGHIKAIANLKKSSEGVYDEVYNYAVGESSEPGSTFKLASLIAALEAKVIDINDIVDCGDGSIKYADREMTDVHDDYGKITMKRVFEVSSNVGVSQIIYKGFNSKPQKFVDYLYKIGLHKPLGVEIHGEGKPFIKNTKDPSWSKTTLPWMAIGYEVSMTPLQILTLYNAVANGGKMVKPLFVKEIRQTGKVIESYETQVLNEAICSKETLKKVQEILLGVVESGTASNLKNPVYKIAGKTGTAQIAQGKSGYRNEEGVSYKASFVGYFPADNPKYSCIVVVNNPSGGLYYGSSVAAPVFKEIADKVYSTRLDIPKISDTISPHPVIPFAATGDKDDLQNVYTWLNLPFSVSNPGAEWASTAVWKGVAKFNTRNVYYGMMPDVRNMGARDAFYLIENTGLKVIINGKGIVTKQSIAPGTKIIKGSTVYLTLSKG